MKVLRKFISKERVGKSVGRGVGGNQAMGLLLGSFPALLGVRSAGEEERSIDRPDRAVSPAGWTRA